MKIERRSPFSGDVHSMDIDVTEEQLRRWEGGALIQDAMPNLTDDEREFIMTGITPEEWDEQFGEPEAQAANYGFKTGPKGQENDPFWGYNQTVRRFRRLRDADRI